MTVQYYLAIWLKWQAGGQADIQRSIRPAQGKSADAVVQCLSGNVERDEIL